MTFPNYKPSISVLSIFKAGWLSYDVWEVRCIKCIVDLMAVSSYSGLLGLNPIVS